MSLSTATLAQLARKRAGVGAVRTAQDGSPYTSFTGTAPTTDGDGVDTSDALLANVIVTPTGGDATWSLWGRSQTGAWEQLDGWANVVSADGVATKYRALCESELELYVVLEATTAATSVAVAIEPCNG